MSSYNKNTCTDIHITAEQAPTSLVIILFFPSLLIMCLLVTYYNILWRMRYCIPTSPPTADDGHPCDTTIPAGPRCARARPVSAVRAGGSSSAARQSRHSRGRLGRIRVLIGSGGGGRRCIRGSRTESDALVDIDAVPFTIHPIPISFPERPQFTEGDPRPLIFMQRPLLSLPRQSLQ